MHKFEVTYQVLNEIDGIVSAELAGDEELG